VSPTTERAEVSQRVSHYQILGKLGAGGMGEVYLAEDTRLGRKVALKFLPASYQYDPERRARFRKEARAASALRSPNIAAIYDIGEHEGSSFIVMEYVEGETLSRRLMAGPLHPREVTEAAIQIADALDEAHSLGIIHRDIKSANVIVTPRGLVKVLDFGLAKITEQRAAADPDDGDLTMPLGQKTTHGLVLGTVHYMSPEQALGRTVDHRSDIFSLGVLVYELLTARLPFEGESSTEVINNILHQEPMSITRLNYGAPQELERIARKCMEKDRESRYQSARELVIDLRNFQRDGDSGSAVKAPPTRPMQPERKARARKAIDSLAILPLENASGDADAEYLSDGITESIINSLSHLPKLRVMARSTVFRYKGREVDPLAVAADLGVRAVLTGRVLQRGDKLVIKVELVDAADGAQLWGEQYNRQMADIFAVEEEISKEISDKLRLKLSGEQKKQLAKRHTESAAAYQQYLKGRYHWNKRTEEGLRKGIEHFQQAIDSDPAYALAYAGLADSYNILASYNSLAPAEAFPRAKRAATAALELDPALAEAHASLAFVILGYDWDYAGAEDEFKLAIRFNAGYATAHHWYALCLAALGRWTEAAAEIKQAGELDPLSLAINTGAGWILYLGRQYERAIEQYQKALEMDPNFTLARRRLGHAYEALGRYDEAIAEFQKALGLFAGDIESLASLGHAYAKSGDRGRAERVLGELTEMSARRYVPAYMIAKIHTGLGDKHEAFGWLDKACEERYGLLVYSKVEPALDPLRDDARFESLARRLRLA
jgi:serine/threonine protein kinase/tetratricopeptide (TPR) repeat protein